VVFAHHLIAVSQSEANIKIFPFRQSCHHFALPTRRDRLSFGDMAMDLMFNSILSDDVMLQMI
jgi:hypothetical protein